MFIESINLVFFEFCLRSKPPYAVIILIEEHNQ